MVTTSSQRFPLGLFARCVGPSVCVERIPGVNSVVTIRYICLCFWSVSVRDNNRGFPYEDVFYRILENSTECDKSLKHELGSTQNVGSNTTFCNFFYFTFCRILQNPIRKNSSEESIVQETIVIKSGNKTWDIKLSGSSKHSVTEEVCKNQKGNSVILRK